MQAHREAREWPSGGAERSSDGHRASLRIQRKPENADAYAADLPAAKAQREIMSGLVDEHGRDSRGDDAAPVKKVSEREQQHGRRAHAESNASHPFT
jgi:hypothetical protein